MGAGTSSGKSAAPTQSGGNLSPQKINQLKYHIDNTSFTKVGSTYWELNPKAKEIQTMGAHIQKENGVYRVTTWGTTNIQTENLNVGMPSSNEYVYSNLNDAKTAAKEELKGYLPSVKYNKQ